MKKLVPVQKIEQVTEVVANCDLKDSSWGVRLEMSKNTLEKISKEVKQLLKISKRKPKKLNCVAKDKCQINFEEK